MSSFLRIKMHVLVLVLMVFVLRGIEGIENGSSSDLLWKQRVCYSATKPGDLVLGGLFTMTAMGSRNVPCGKRPRRFDVIRTALAMEFSIDEINKQQDLLPNVTLGYDLRDDCMSDDLSLWQSLSLISPGTSKKFQGLCKLDQPNSGQVVGLIGTGISETTLVASRLAGLFNVPVISHGAISDQFSDRKKFPNLFRTATPDRLRTEAILDILKQFDWDYVILLFSANSEGLQGALRFEEMAERRNVCLAQTSYIEADSTDKDRQEIVDKMLQFKTTHVVVTFLRRIDALDIFQTVRDAGESDRFIWITNYPGERALTKRNLSRVISGGIFLKDTRDPVPGFQDYVSSLLKIPEINYVNRWFKEAFCNTSGQMTCSFEWPGWKAFTGRETPVVNAVRAFGHALHAYIQDLCLAPLMDCIATGQFNASHLLHRLETVNFPTAGGNFSFNKRGDAGGGFTISNLMRLEDGTYGMIEVGSWSTYAGFILNETMIQWPNETTQTPRSDCREVCAVGSYKIPLESKCCYNCAMCKHDDIVKNNRCQRCGETEYPDDERTDCVPIAPTPLNYKHHGAILVFVVSVLGLTLCTFTTITGLVYYRNHPLIKASSRELSLIHLLGLTLSFVTAVLVLLPPNTHSCIVTESIAVFSLNLSFSATLLKVIRIYRIFQASKQSVRRPRFISPKSQLTMIGMSVLIEVLLLVISIRLCPSIPMTMTRVIPDEKNIVEQYCQFGSGFLVSVVYNLLLILACCYYAFKTRKVPSNYNESKFIAVSVYSTLVLCLAAVPVYTTATEVILKIGTFCVVLQLNAMLGLVCMYLPKLYAVRFVKEGTGVGNNSCQRSSGPPNQSQKSAQFVDACRVHPISISENINASISTNIAK